MSNFLIVYPTGLLYKVLRYLADLCLDSMSINVCCHTILSLFMKILTFFSEMTIFGIIKI